MLHSHDDYGLTTITYRIQVTNQYLASDHDTSIPIRIL